MRVPLFLIYISAVANVCVLVRIRKALCSFDNAEEYNYGVAEKLMGDAIKVRQQTTICPYGDPHNVTAYVML